MLCWSCPSSVWDWNQRNVKIILIKVPIFMFDGLFPSRLRNNWFLATSQPFCFSQVVIRLKLPAAPSNASISSLKLCFFTLIGKNTVLARASKEFIDVCRIIFLSRCTLIHQTKSKTKLGGFLVDKALLNSCNQA